VSIHISPGPPTTEEEVHLLEAELGRSLPDQYRRFLLTSNGGNPDRHAVATAPFEIEVRRFYSIGSIDGFVGVDIRWALNGSGPFPSGHIPIGEDQGGNSFILALDGPDRGAVYFWDHELELDQPNPEIPTFEPATKLSDDFDGLLDAMRPD
jgi:hypothetical protein